MEQVESTKSMKLVSSTKISSSRILKFALIVISIITILYLVSLSAIYLLSVKSLAEGITNEQIDLIEKVAEFLRISPETTIVTLSTAVIARYLARESIVSWKGKYPPEEETTTTTEEKKE